MGIEGLIPTIGTVILGLVATFLGAKFVNWKRKAADALNLLTVVIAAVEDNELDMEETKKVVAAYKRLIGSTPDVTPPSV